MVKEKLEKKIKTFLCAGAIGLAVACSSCSSQDVKSRLGCTPTIKMFRSFPDYDNLGIHNSSEKNGLVYCCKAGHIDLAHLRKGADFANVYTKKFFTYLMSNEKEFSFKMKEPCTYFVKLDYPKNWQSLSEQNKKEIVENVSIQIGEYASFLGTTWHEMLTWFGYKMTGIIPEYHSAFTIDDSFSNFLGAYIAGNVLRENKEIFNNPTSELNKKLFNEKFTLALSEELEKLGAQAPKISGRAADRTNNKKRHLNIGLSGYITAYILPGFNECGGMKSALYPVQNTNLSKYGFSMKLEIEPRDGAGIKMRKIVGKGSRERIEPENDFPIIMNYIEKDAVKRGLVPVY